MRRRLDPPFLKAMLPCITYYEMLVQNIHYNKALDGRVPPYKFHKIILFYLAKLQRIVVL